MSGAIPLLPNTLSWRGAQLKHRDNFTLRFISGLHTKWFNSFNSCIYIAAYFSVSLELLLDGLDGSRAASRNVVYIMHVRKWMLQIF
jgi:hypothetical protein